MKKRFTTLYNRFRFWLSAQNSFLYLWYYRYFYTPRPGSLAEVLNEFSRQTPAPLTVVQIGANDGFNNDPIHKFIKRDGWQGVLLEPQKWVFDRYLTKIYRKNPGIQVLNAALGESEGEMPLYKISFSQARWATGLATFDKAQMEMALASPYVAKQAAKEGVTIPSRPEDQLLTEAVPVISPQGLLRKYEIAQIDLLQIDTEGFDYEVIQLFDVATTQPRLIIFESCHLSESDFTACMAHLQAAGYQTKTMGANSVAELQGGGNI